MTKRNLAQEMFADDEEQTQSKPAQKAPQEIDNRKPVSVSGSGLPTHTLPSQGRLGYPSIVEARDILVKDEETLSMVTQQNYAETLNSVIKNILNGCQFFEQMTIHDRDFLLVTLWANNYNPVKEVEVECKHCEEKEVHKVDLTNLEVNELASNIKVPFKIPLSLGDEGSHVNVHLSTVADELEVERFMNENPNDKHKYEFLMMVQSIDLGMNIPLAKKIGWIGENMTGKEMGYVRKFHEYFNFGVNDIVEYKCSACKGVTQGQLPFQITDILFPTVPGDFEDLL